MSGWWTSTNEEQARAIEAERNDDFRVATFSTIVDGTTSNLVPYWQVKGKHEQASDEVLLSFFLLFGCD